MRRIPWLPVGAVGFIILLALAAPLLGLANPVTMEVARRLGRSPRAVDRLAAEGALRKVLLPGRTRAAGFRESDVAALIAWGTP